MSTVTVKNSSLRTLASRGVVTRAASVASIAVLGVTLAACSGGSKSPTNTAAVGTTNNANVGTQQIRTAPGAFGTIASLSSSDMQVQSQQGQTQVTYGSSTAIEQEKAGKLSDVTVGSCVTIMGTPDESDETKLTEATRVSISQPVDGSCSNLGLPGAGGGGFFGGGGGQFPGGVRPSGAPDFQGGGQGAPPNFEGGQPPAGALPSGAPNPGQGARAFNFGSASGKVTAVSGSTITLEGTLRSPRSFGNGQRPTGAPTAQPDPAATPSPQPTKTITATTASTTTYTTTVKAAASALKVGQCVSALGKANDIGAVAATSITIRESADSCTTRFRGRGNNANGSGSTTTGTANG